MKKYNLKLVTLGLTLTMALVLSACGSGDSTNANADNSTISEVNKDVTSENTDNSLEADVKEEVSEEISTEEAAKEDKTSGFTFAASMPEEDIIMVIDGVKVPLTSTFDEFKTIASDNNWTCDLTTPDGGAKEITTANGKFEIRFMLNPDNIYEIRDVEVISRNMPDGYIDVHGITARTNPTLLATMLEHKAHDTSEYINYFYLNEYVTITFMGSRDYPDNPDFSVTRTFYTKR